MKFLASRSRETASFADPTYPEEHSDVGISVLTVRERVLICAALVGAAASAAGATYAERTDAIATGIRGIANRIRAVDVLDDQQRYEPAAAINDRLFEHATSLFKGGAFAEAIPEFVAFMQASHAIEPTRYLKVQAMLAFCYRSVGNVDQAARAYLRYLESQRQQKITDRDDFNEVIEQLVRIAKLQKVFSTSDSRRLLNALSGMQLPPEERSRLLFHASDADTANDVLQAEWLAQALELSPDIHLKLRILYKQAALALKSNNSKSAFTKINLLLASAKGLAEKDDIVDLATLSLARMRASAGQMQQAISLYESIAKDATVARDRDLDLIYAYRDIGAVEKSYGLGQRYIKDYAGHESALRVREFLGLLAVEANDLDKANSELNGFLNQLAKFRKDIGGYTASADGFDFNQLYKTTLAITGDAGMPDLVKAIATLQNRIVATSQHLQAIESNLRYEIFALSQMQLRDYDPHYENLAAVYRSSLEGSLLLAHELMAESRHNFAAFIPKTIAADLAASEQRRFAIAGRIQEWLTKRETWTSHANIEMLKLDLVRQSELVRRLRADLALINLDAMRRGKAASELAPRLAKIERDIADQFAGLQVYKLETQPRRSVFNEAITFHSQYSDLLHEEFATLSQLLKQEQDPRMQYSKRDFFSTWQQWESVDRRLATLASATAGKLSIDHASLAEHYRSSLARMNKLQQQVLVDDVRLYQLKLKYLHAMEEVVVATIDRKTSQYRKWLADSFWLKSEGARKTATLARAELESTRITGPIIDEGMSNEQ